MKNKKKYEREKLEDMQRWKQYQLSGIYINHDRVAARLKSLAEGEL